MKKLILGPLLLLLMMGFPLSTMAELHINVGIPVPNIRIPLPPRIHFPDPPRLVVLPGTYVYAAPDVDEEIFFHDGWWWRPWEGGWYRSRHYNSGWQHYKNTPSFYHKVPRGWRNDYRERHWQGRQWNVEPLPHDHVQRNWKHWKNNRHWEKNQPWGPHEPRDREDYHHPRRDSYREHPGPHREHPGPHWEHPGPHWRP